MSKKLTSQTGSIEIPIVSCMLSDHDGRLNIGTQSALWKQRTVQSHL